MPNEENKLAGLVGRTSRDAWLRFARGTSFMGADLAEWLEAEYEKEKRTR